MTATLRAHDRTVIDRDTRCRCLETITRPTSSAQPDQGDFPLLNQMLNAYEPAANRIVNTVAVTSSTSSIGYAVTREAGAASS